MADAVGYVIGKSMNDVDTTIGRLEAELTRTIREKFDELQQRLNQIHEPEKRAFKFVGEGDEANQLPLGVSRHLQ